METTEKIVEAYARYVKGWFTIPNIKCQGQFEIDLLAIDAASDGAVCRYHIESGVSISGAYSRLTNKPFSTEDLRVRVKLPKKRPIQQPHCWKPQWHPLRRVFWPDRV